MKTYITFLNIKKKVFCYHGSIDDSQELSREPTEVNLKELKVSKCQSGYGEVEL